MLHHTTSIQHSNMPVIFKDYGEVLGFYLLKIS